MSDGGRLGCCLLVLLEWELLKKKGEEEEAAGGWTLYIFHLAMTISTSTPKRGEGGTLEDDGGGVPRPKARQTTTEDQAWHQCALLRNVGGHR